MRKPSRRTLLAGVAAAFVSPPLLAQTVTRQKVTAALPRLEQFVRQVVERKLVPGLSIAVVHHDEVVYLQGFGVRQIGMPEPVEVDTVFQLASVSKPLSSTVVSALVSEGKVSWDSRIRDIDPGFAPCSVTWPASASTCPAPSRHDPGAADTSCSLDRAHPARSYAHMNALDHERAGCARSR